MFKSLAIVAALTCSVAQCHTLTVSANTTFNASTNILINTSANATAFAFTNTTTATPTVSTVCDQYTIRCYTDITYVAVPIASTGSGGAYATSCQNIQKSYYSVSNSWTNKHQSVSLATQVYGGDYESVVSYYKNASTLCDGHPRVTYSPAILESTSTTTITQAPTATTTGTYTVGYIFPISSPECSINPSDCDSLWADYTTSVSQFNAQETGASFVSQITASPEAPFCVNSTQESSEAAFSSSFYACGPCTIFGNGVELLYFPEPTTVSRDMCASTPSGTVTWYADDVGTPYAGTGVPQTAQNGTALQTAVLDGKTYTSGMAYISIASVWTGDRCTGSKGSAISSAVIALPSESLLSLRYSQDHFQYFMAQSSVTGYPFNYADMQKPIPYSAWIGQTQCDGPEDTSCNVIYENDFNPQLAMPPGIRKLSPDWGNCNLWYGGLYDPPKALQPATAVASATQPGQKHSSQSTTASPSSTLTSSQPAVTALYDTNGEATTSVASSAKQSQVSSNAAESAATDSPSSQAGTSGSGSIHSNVRVGAVVTVADAVYTVTSEAAGAVVDGTTLAAGGSAVTIEGTVVSMGGHCGCLLVGSSTVDFSTLEAAATATSAQSQVAVVTLGGSSGSKATAYAAPGSPSSAVFDSTTLSVGGAAETLSSGVIVSLASNGLVVQAASTTITQSFSSIPTSNDAVSNAVTLSVGGPAMTLSSGEVVSLASNGVVVQVSSTNVPQTSTTSLAASLSATATDNAIAASITLSVGGPAETLSNGDIVSLASNGLVVQASSTTFTQALASASASASTGPVSTGSGKSSSSKHTSGVTTSSGSSGTRTTRSTSRSGTSGVGSASAATTSSAAARQVNLERGLLCLALMSLCFSLI